MRFVDMAKAFDQIRRMDIKILWENGINQKLIQIVRKANKHCKIRQSNNKRITSKHWTLSPFMFNMIMDKIIEKLPPAGYKMGNTNFHIIYYAENTVHDSGDNLQQLFHNFNQKTKRWNMLINTDGTKCLVTSKEPKRYKLENERKSQTV